MWPFICAFLWAVGSWAVMQFEVIYIDEQGNQTQQTFKHVLFACLWPVTVPLFFLAQRLGDSE